MGNVKRRQIARAQKEKRVKKITLTLFAIAAILLIATIVSASVH